MTRMMGLLQTKIRGKNYYFKMEDLSPRFAEVTQRLFRREPVAREDLMALYHRITEIGAHTIVIDAARFKAEMPDVLKENLLSQRKKVEVKGESTLIKGSDEGRGSGSSYSSLYASLYGVATAAVPLEPVFETTPCRSWKNRGPGVFHPSGQHQTVRRILLLGENKEKTRAIEYCRTEGSPNRESLGSAMAFLWQYRPERDAAVRALASQHPGLSPENIALFFMELIQLEFFVFDRVDLYQDIAASGYADSPWHQAFNTDLPSFLNRAAKYFSKWGWRAYSALSGVPIENQGLGPLQIIPSLAMAACREQGLLASYGSLVGPGDFTDLKSLIRALFDPKKMFAIKAMTWDLQLRQMERIEGLTVSPVYVPHLFREKPARELAVLWGARQLVQFPRQSVEDFQNLFDMDYDGLLLSLYQIGHLQGIAPRFEGIETLLSADCPPESFGYYQIGSRADKVCLSQPNRLPLP